MTRVGPRQSSQSYRKFADILKFIAQVTTEKRPLDTVAVGALARVFETVGLSLFLTWWGTHTNPFE
jgi:hypothetical protein